MEIKIIDVEQKTSKTGSTYNRFKTSHGWMSCFEEGCVAKLKENIGNIINVTIAERNGFKNIVGVGDVVTGSLNVPVITPGMKIPSDNAFNNENRDLMMLTSYVKDLVVAGTETTEAVNVVMSARNMIKKILNAQDGDQ